jgi:hypothetical protein
MASSESLMWKIVRDHDERGIEGQVGDAYAYAARLVRLEV